MTTQRFIDELPVNSDVLMSRLKKQMDLLIKISSLRSRYQINRLFDELKDFHVDAQHELNDKLKLIMYLCRFSHMCLASLANKNRNLDVQDNDNIFSTILKLKNLEEQYNLAVARNKYMRANKEAVLGNIIEVLGIAFVFIAVLFLVSALIVPGVLISTLSLPGPILIGIFLATLFGSPALAVLSGVLAKVLSEVNISLPKIPVNNKPYFTKMITALTKLDDDLEDVKPNEQLNALRGR